MTIKAEKKAEELDALNVDWISTKRKRESRSERVHNTPALHWQLMKDYK